LHCWGINESTQEKSTPSAETHWTRYNPINKSKNGGYN
jgi:hypothetical protein